MDAHNYSVLNNLLISNGYHIKKQILFAQYNSHPDAGSFKSITDTLTYLKVEHLAVSIPKEAFYKIEGSVIADMIKGDQRELAVAKVLPDEKVQVTSDQKHIVPITEFLESWGGMIIAVEPNNQKETLLKNPTVLLGVLLVVLLGTTAVFSKGFLLEWTLLFDILSVVGLGLAFLVLSESDYSSSSGSLCKVIGKSDCGDVINSPQSKVSKSISLTDLTVIYFAGVFITNLLYGSNSSLYYISLIALLVIPYSLYLQINVLKKWCLLCLTVSIVLVGQTLLLSLDQTVNDFQVSEFLSSLSSFGVVACIWFLVVPFLKKVKDYDRQYLNSLSFKRNYHLFLSYYSQSEKSDVDIHNSIHWGGNRNASTRIVAITNPLCSTCFDTERVLAKIIEDFPEQISVSLKFYVPVGDVSDVRFKVASAIINARQVLSDEKFKEHMAEWLNTKKRDVWKKFQSTNNHTISDEILNKSFEWSIKNGINATPVLFINERKFPAFYDPTDIENFISEVVSFEETLSNTEKNTDKKLEPAMPAH